MKRSLFLAILFIAFSYVSSAQSKDTCTCPPKEHPVTSPTNPVPIKKDRTLYPKPSISNMNSNNVTITINANQYKYPDDPSIRREKISQWYGYSDNNQWLIVLLILALLVLIAVYIHHFSQKGSGGSGTTISPVTVHLPQPLPAPSPTIVVPPSSDELTTAMDKAATTGGIFMRSKDGGYTIDFPKPPVKEKKED